MFNICKWFNLQKNDVLPKTDGISSSISQLSLKVRIFWVKQENIKRSKGNTEVQMRRNVTLNTC